ncbi:MAG: elongation factor G [Candidatus Eremiobacter antarcticus]|nr:elongation factor G [Candidatus Eremiobacteraeota bacterium]MBC5807882.1 elongation factor G [Candidatus Eremiobacteraeota bacterium]PZR62747.1 MAG: elongation factor G [Candidatus Eremiobacter sp. RRmetagenome_bin22]
MMAAPQAQGIRNVAFVGPHHSGKTTLVEALLAHAQAIPRKGAVTDGTATTDHDPEAQAHQMSVAPSFAYLTSGNVRVNIIDCPGAVDFFEETRYALLAADAAVIVVEADPNRLAQVEALVDYLESKALPHCFVINRVDRPGADFISTYAALRQRFGNHVVAEQAPIGQGEGFSGFVDVVAMRAYKYGDGGAAASSEFPDNIASKNHEELLEALADFDDHLMEEILEGQEPSLEEVERDLATDVSADKIIPVLVASGVRGWGAPELLAVMIRQFPDATTISRTDRSGKAVEPSPSGPVVAQVCKTMVHPQSGKLSIARIFSGTLNADAQLVNVSRGDVKERPGGLYTLLGKAQAPANSVGPGNIVAIARLESAQTGDTLCTGAAKTVMPLHAPPKPAFTLALRPHERSDEAKLSQLLVRMKEEDPTLSVERAPFTDELCLHGYGEMHLAVTVERLQRKYNVKLDTQLPQVPYRETITGKTQQQGRYKHQTGGHGMFGDVHVEIEPLPRGKGFKFDERIVGGAVPKNFFPGVEKGVREALEKGPIGGFPVVDVHVTLYDGSYHSVDSNEMSFKLAASLAMREGLPKCHPVLLEPIQRVEITVPSHYTSTVLQQVSGRRGQIASYGPAEGRRGYDTVKALIPQSELPRYLTDLRTATQGLGYFTAEHDHFEYAPPKVVQTVTAERKEMAVAK